MKDAVANHVAFNRKDPIILVGDQKGGVNSFILSKNLKKGPVDPKTAKEEERAKMEAFLSTLDKEVY